MTKALSLLGVPITLHPTTLISGVVSAIITAAVVRNDRVQSTVGAGLLWYVADCTHVVGHIVSSQAVNAPLDAIDFGLYPKNVYHNNAISPQQHIGRSIGGVGASFLAALLLILAARLINHGLIKKLLTIAAIQNAFLFIISMLPVPMVDGGVMYANVRKLND